MPRAKELRNMSAFEYKAPDSILQGSGIVSWLSGAQRGAQVDQKKDHKEGIVNTIKFS